MLRITEHTRARAFETTEEYRVEGITTETNEQIIDFCNRNNFGGYVYRYGQGCARVEINID